MTKLTKSKYVTYCLCPAKARRDAFDPLPENGDPQRSKDGQEVGALTRDYFGKNTCVLLGKSAKAPLNPGLYAEYPLRFGDLECYVDVLRINQDRLVDIYEVKSVNDYETSKGSGKQEKRYLEDVCFRQGRGENPASTGQRNGGKSRPSPEIGPAQFGLTAIS